MGDLMFGDMSCNIKVDTQKVRAYIYMEFESAFLCFFMECAHCQKKKKPQQKKHKLLHAEFRAVHSK